LLNFLTFLWWAVVIFFIHFYFEKK
jgi:hypothetical protein